MVESEHLTRICKALSLIPSPRGKERKERRKEERKGKKKGQRKEGNFAWVCWISPNLSSLH